MHDAPRKLCVIGHYRVGKTRLVHALTGSVAPRPTLGVHLYPWTYAGGRVEFLLFDAAGRSSLDSLGQSFLSGAQGFALVADGGDRASVDTALRLYETAQQLVGQRPGVLMLNKNDLGEPDRGELLPALPPGLPVFSVSAATGDGVQAAFAALAEQVLRDDGLTEPPLLAAGVVGVS